MLPVIHLSNVTSRIVTRDVNTHKGNYGHGLLIAGSCGMAGAAVMAARACLRSGIGLLTVATPECNRDIVQQVVPEAMTIVVGDEEWTSTDLDLSRYSAIAIGPGLGTSGQTSQALLTLLHKIQDQLPVVLDADALNILSHHPEVICDLSQDAILTPHPGEFNRLLQNWEKTYREEAREQQAVWFARFTHKHIILKGHHTIVASSIGLAEFNPTGNPGMATGGSGDVLTGILLSLRAQGLPPYDASRLGVYVHGLAGDLASERFTQIGMTATDIITCLPDAWRMLMKA